MGAPGSYYWTGTIKVYNLTSDSFYSPNKDNVDSHRYSYLGNFMAFTPKDASLEHLSCFPWLSRGAVTANCVSTGYSVTAGHFSAPNVIDIAAGAPQYSGSGKVRSAPPAQRGTLWSLSLQ